MLIKNFRELATSRDKEIVLRMLDSGLQVGLPKNRIRKFVHKGKLSFGKHVKSLLQYDHIFLVAFGKAAYSMACEVDSLIRTSGGIIVIPKGYSAILKKRKFKVIHSGHPIPNKNSIVAANQLIKFLHERKNNDLVIFLVSGGASSLVSLPDGIDLGEKQSVIELLIKCGASIDEINCVRKHLSKIKGGRLLEHLKCDATSLVMSDVIDDDITTIASGTTSFDKTTFSDAEKVLKKYNLWNRVPKNVRKRILLGLAKKIPETPKKEKIKNHIIASNMDCLMAMEKMAKSFGLSPKTVYPVYGDVKQNAKNLANLIANARHNSCVVFGGEPTVIVKGNGKGGRNQELVLHVLKKIQDVRQKIIVASIGTDGRDGNTNACGAILDKTANVIGATRFLKRNDSYNFLKKKNGLIFTGPTHTNLMDIGILLKR
jgi:hydroxypyruvate reductase